MLLIDPYLSDYSYIVALYFYHITSRNLHSLLEIRFAKNLADRKLILDRKFVNVSISVHCWNLSGGFIDFFKTFFS